MKDIDWKAALAAFGSVVLVAATIFAGIFVGNRLVQWDTWLQTAATRNTIDQVHVYYGCGDKDGAEDEPEYKY